MSSEEMSFEELQNKLDTINEKYPDPLVEDFSEENSLPLADDQQNL